MKLSQHRPLYVHGHRLSGLVRRLGVRVGRLQPLLHHARLREHVLLLRMVHLAVELELPCKLRLDLT